MSKWTDVPSGQVNAAKQRLFVAMGDKADLIIKKIVSDDGLAPRLMKLALTGDYEHLTSHTRAREIMGKNYFGPDDAIKYFDVSLTKQQLAYLAGIPFSEDVLIACKDTHILVAIVPISIFSIRYWVKGKKLLRDQKSLFYNQDWYNNETFALNDGEFCWKLVQKTPVENSVDCDKQYELLSKEDEVPDARVLVYVIIGHFLNTGERLFEKVYVRCSDVNIYVGAFRAGGLVIKQYGASGDPIGMSSARKQ